MLRLIFRAASPFDHRGKENVYMMGDGAQKHPTGKTKYRFVIMYAIPILQIYICYEKNVAFFLTDTHQVQKAAALSASEGAL